LVTRADVEVIVGCAVHLDGKIRLITALLLES
jgi:hypothetical protein